MSRRLALVVLPVLAAGAAVPAHAATLTADDAQAAFVGPMTVSSHDPATDWPAAQRAPGATVADADLAGLTIAMAVQPGGARRPIASNAAAVPKSAARLPEPATWVMLILGFGGIGAAVRRQLRRSDERFNEHIRRIAASGDEPA